MSKKLFPLKSLCLAALLCASAAANAAITIYTSEGAFAAAVSAPGLDNFDDLGLEPLGPSLTRSAGAYSYTASSPDGLWGAGAGADHWLSNNVRTQPIVFNGFTGGVNAFGGNFFGTDLGGSYVPGSSLVLTANDGSTLTYSLDNATLGSFLGFTSDSGLSSVTLASSAGANYWPTVNNLVLAVPEPATYGMFLAGLGFVAVMARRRRG